MTTTIIIIINIVIITSTVVTMIGGLADPWSFLEGCLGSFGQFGPKWAHGDGAPEKMGCMSSFFDDAWAHLANLVKMGKWNQASPKNELRELNFWRCLGSFVQFG
ncbi:MAG: hypothetical protein GY849_24450, partial [Deltaproteobacteria bacterium]|nr:hypothetical protein [Deltaproteobacteria bacterium]